MSEPKRTQPRLGPRLRCCSLGSGGQVTPPLWASVLPGCEMGVAGHSMGTGITGPQWKGHPLSVFPSSGSCLEPPGTRWAPSAMAVGGFRAPALGPSDSIFRNLHPRNAHTSDKGRGTGNSTHHCLQQQNSGNAEPPPLPSLSGPRSIGDCRDVKALPKGRARAGPSTCFFQGDKEPEPARAFQQGHRHVALL